MRGQLGLGWTSLSSPTRGHGLLVCILFYLIVVFPKQICERDRHKLETIQSNRRKNEPCLPLLGRRVYKAGMCAKTSPSCTKWRHENCALVTVHVPVHISCLQSISTSCHPGSLLSSISPRTRDRSRRAPPGNLSRALWTQLHSDRQAILGQLV